MRGPLCPLPQEIPAVVAFRPPVAFFFERRPEVIASAAIFVLTFAFVGNRNGICIHVSDGSEGCLVVGSLSGP